MISDQDSLDNSIKIVKKYKKKLHQIARLEMLDRKLTVEEMVKINSKEDIRQKLKEILAVVNAKDDSFNSISSIEATGDANSAFANIIDNSTSKDENDQDTKYLEINSIASNEEHQNDTMPPPTKKPLTVLEESTDSIGDGTSADVSQPVKKDAEIDEFSLAKLRKAWKKKTFEVTELTGHNGIASAVDISGSWLVTGSHDTSVKLWDLATTEELRNLPGHTGAVTCVEILDKQESNKLYKSLNLDSNEVSHLGLKSLKSERILLTSSVDCSVKIWLLPQGFQLKSIYTFSPISTLLDFHSLVFAGSDSGKLTAFELATGRQLCDSNIHDDKITSLKWDGKLLLSASFDGGLKLWNVKDFEKIGFDYELPDDVVLTLAYSLKNNLSYVSEKPILCACFYEEKIVFGDDGFNLKLVDISEDVILKYPNHVSGSGFTDSLAVFNNLLVSTSYNPVDGIGSLNVRILEENSSLSYIASLSYSSLPRLLGCVADKPSQSHYLVTGGEKILVWKRKSASADVKDTLKKKMIKAKYLIELSRTEVSSDCQSEETETEEGSTSWWWGGRASDKTTQRRTSISQDSTDSSDSQSLKTETNTASSWWCSLV